MTTCPQGHQTSAADYCDVCGAPLTPGSAPAAPPAPANPAPTSAPASQPGRCPHCQAENVADALFCEACGYDFTTGTMPRPEASSIPTPSRPDELEDVPSQATVAPGSAGPAPVPAATATETPTPAAQPAGGSSTETTWVAEIWVDPDWYALQNSADPMPSPGLPEVVPLRGRSLLIGRISRSRNIHPDIDCESDSGVSRRQAQLTTDGDRWFVEDLQSANGTFLAPASGPLPKDPLPPGQKTQIQDDHRLYVGAWTRMVIRPAAPGEVDAG